MVYLEINRKNYDTGTPNLIEKLNKHLNSKDDNIFILYFMEGCGPCNATRPEWSKLKNVLSNDFLKKNDIVIVSIDKDLAEKLTVGKEPNSFPTMKYMKNKGKINENYEDSNISIKDRSIDSFVEWIKTKTGNQNITKSEIKSLKGGKWSLKYKRSIDCKRPKGFSQRQHCKYGHKNMNNITKKRVRKGIKHTFKYRK
jgi:thiol-disulfide isomerase/thioredoxin